jgi:hypothetical protein
MMTVGVMLGASFDRSTFRQQGAYATSESVRWATSSPTFEFYPTVVVM